MKVNGIGEIPLARGDAKVPPERGSQPDAAREVYVASSQRGCLVANDQLGPSRSQAPIAGVGKAACELTAAPLSAAATRKVPQTLSMEEAPVAVEGSGPGLTLADAVRQASLAGPVPAAPLASLAAPVQASPQPTLAASVQAASPVLLPQTGKSGQAGASTWRAFQLLGNQFKSLVGKGDVVVSLRAELDSINGLEKMAQSLQTPADFAAKTAEFKQRLANGESLESLRPEAYAVAREACVKALPAPASGVKMRPYDAQMLGALAMDQGRIAEMRTGEGKTMTAVMPVYLNALAGKGVHVITANETLAARDSQEMGPAYQMLGLKVETCLEGMSSEQKRRAYSADVTYLTNSTLGFDYLRDRTCRDADQRVQRPPFFALVDEVDEVLIDEARVPLIISATTQPAQGLYQTYSDLAGQLTVNDDFEVDREKHAAYLTETGQDWVANELGRRRYQGHLEKAEGYRSEASQALQAPDSEATRAKFERRLERSQRLADRAQVQLGVASQIAPAIREEQKLSREIDAYQSHKPKLLEKLSHFWENTAPAQPFESKVLDSKKEALETLRSQRKELTEQFPGFDLYHPAHSGQLPYLYKAVEARGLFQIGNDYTSALGDKLDQQTSDICRRLKLAPNEGNQTRILLAAQNLSNDLADRVGLQKGDTGGSWTVQNLAAPLCDLIGEKAQEQNLSVDHYLDKMLTETAGQKGLTPAALLGDVFRGSAELKIVDEFKGRIAEGRRFSDGLHQSLEAKEGLPIKPEQRSVATITYPNLFRRYPRLAGMSGTAKVAEKEFRELYGLEVVVIPTNKPVKMIEQPDLVFQTSQEKFTALVSEAKRCYEEGIPVLLGTRSVEVNRKLVEMLNKADVPCQSVNADDIKNNTSRENTLLGRAGQSGWVTVATNMAGRGVDIKEDQVNFKKTSLVASTLASPGLIAQFGLDKNDPQKLEQWNEFLGQCKIDPADFNRLIASAQTNGQNSLPVVLDVESPKEAQRLAEWFNSPKERGEAAMPFEIADGSKPAAAPQPGVIQIRLPAAKVASPGCLHLKSSDFPTGGLRILGSERHASRRIDLQLTGRAGRQGRPGSAQFFISLDDDLLKVYGGDSVVKAHSKMIQGGKLSDAELDKLVVDCQDKVENANYEARLDTTKFDRVMNEHRQRFYDFRELLVNSRPGPTQQGEQVPVDATACEWTTDALVRATKLEFRENQAHGSEGSFRGKMPELDPTDLDRQTHDKHSAVEVREALQKAAEKMGIPLQVVLRTNPLSLSEPPGSVILDANSKVATRSLEDFIAPAVERVVADLSSRLATQGFRPQELQQFEWESMVNAMDSAWTDHLENMESLKKRATLEAKEGMEPVKVYETLALRAFKQTIAAYQGETASKIVPGMLKTLAVMANSGASIQRQS